MSVFFCDLGIEAPERTRFLEKFDDMNRERERERKTHVTPLAPVAPRGPSLYIRMYALVICEEMNEVSKKTSENDRSHEIDVAMREAISAERK